MSFHSSVTCNLCKFIKAVLSPLLSADFLLQEAEKEAVCLKKTLQRSEKELQELRTAVIEKDQKHQRRTARHEQQSRRWAQDIHAECVCLQEFIKQNGLTVENKHSSERYSIYSTLWCSYTHNYMPCWVLKRWLQPHTFCIGPDVGNAISNPAYAISSFQNRVYLYL